MTAHALSGKTEDGDGRDEKDQIVELPLLLDNDVGNIKQRDPVPLFESTHSLPPPFGPRQRGGANWED